MAVIREKRQFKVGPIGVARAPRFGQSGGQIVGESISRSADQFAEMFYREAAQEAEKTGIEQARSVEREKVVTINPKTGEPEAYAPPSGFGTVAAEAYERVVLRRFEQSIEDEIQNKAKELSVRYENSANGASLYETAMSDYIASMSNVAEGQFKTYIADVGTSYLNATRSNMAIAQVRRERRAARKSQIAAVAKANEGVEYMIAEYGPEALTGPTQVQAMIQSANVTAGDGAEAGLIDPAELRSMNGATQMSVAKGLIRYAAKQTDDPDQLKMLQHAVGTQNPSAVPPEFSYVSEVMRGFGGNYGALAGLEKFSDGVLSDAVQYSNIVQEQEIARQETEMAMTIFDMENELPVRTAAESVMAINPNSTAAAVATRSISSFAEFTQQARQALAEGQTDLSEQYISQRDAVLNSQAEGLYLRALSGASRDEVDQIERAVVERNPAFAPETARPAVNAILRLDGETGQGIAEGFGPFAGSYREGAGRAVDAEREANAAAQASAVDIRGVAFSDTPVDAATARIDQINEIEGMDANLRNSLISQVQFNAGKSSLNTFFSGNPNDRQMAEAQSLIEGGTVAKGVLTDAQIENLAIARDFANESGKISEMRTVFNNQKSVVGNRRQFAEEQTKKLRILQKIEMGMGDSRSEDERSLYEDDMERRYAMALGGRTLASVWSDPSAMQNPDLAPIFDELSGSNMMPESLHDALTAFARGAWRGGDPNTLLSHYTNFRDYQFGSTVMTNPMMDSLTDSERTMLDFLADTIPVFGNQSPERTAQMFETKRQYEEDPQVKEKFKAFFDDQDVYEYARSLDGMDDAPPNRVNTMAAAALDLFTTSRSTGLSRREITKRLERQIDKSFPSGDGVVFGPNFSGRTQFPISRAAPGNEDLFREHVIDRVTLMNPDMRVNLGEGRAKVDLNLMRPGFERAEDFVYLQPFYSSSDGEVRYLVKQRQPAEAGGDRTVMQPVTIDGMNKVAPMIISNRDPQFLNSVRIRKDAEKRDAAAEARRRMEVYEEFGTEAENMMENMPYAVSPM